MQTLLGGLLKNRRLVGSLRRVMVMSLWEQVVGSLVAQKSWPERVVDGVLVIGVSSHAWASELQLLKPKILANYRRLLGKSALKDIEFCVMSRRSRPADERRPLVPLRPDPQEPLQTEPLPGHLLDGVQNEEVRALLGPVFARLRAEREWKEEHGWRQCTLCDRVYHGATCPHCTTHETH